MKYFITGASGHLGSKVVTELGKLVPKNDIRLGVHTPTKGRSVSTSWLPGCGN